MPPIDEGAVRFVHDFSKIKVASEGRHADTTLATILETAVDTETAPVEGVEEAQPMTKGCKATGKFTSIPGKPLRAEFLSTKFGASFDIKAEFDKPESPCNCSCGEYRQFVRGYARNNGKDVVHKLCSGNLDEKNWQEDCRPAGKKEQKLGHRSAPFVHSNFSDPDQATGCKFSGFDYPGFPLSKVSSGDKLELHLEFEGRLVDVCNKNATLASSSWTIEGTGTVP
jgi:hypothetical protein